MNPETTPAPSEEVPQTPVCAPVAKSKSTYLLLGILLGFFGFPGIHNFYAGNSTRGLVQLLLTICTCWILWLPMFIWTVVEVCTETKDVNGVPFV